VPKLNFLRRLRRPKAQVQSHDLLALRVVGGPVDIGEKVSIPLLPDQSTTPRSVELRCSDADVFVVVWRVGKKTFSVPFKQECDAQGFYNVKMKELREATQREAASIKARLQQQFDESWRGAKTVYHYKGFTVHAAFSINDKHVRINSTCPGLIQGPCPHCGSLQTFDAKEPLEHFLQGLDGSLEAGLMPSATGVFTESSIAVRNRCPVCLNYPNVTFMAQPNKGLLARLKKLGIASPEPEE